LISAENLGESEPTTSMFSCNSDAVTEATVTATGARVAATVGA
jgi:hypothetical protein